MQLLQNSNPCTTNIETKVNFGISKNSTKLFSMLSTSLYSNKERAVLYELGANCSDAHKLNGNEERPWDLVFPTRLDSTIRFRDYGPGLSEEHVYSLLTTYGESTKSDSNTFIGAYGIGSKSPAAVSSNWTVISRHEGMLKEYLVFIDNYGIPSLSKLREVETTDYSGLEVIIPVPTEKYATWKVGIDVAFEYYDVKPNVINYLPTWDNSSDVTVSGTNWKLHGYTQWGVQRNIITTQRKYILSESVFGDFKNESFHQILDAVSFSVDFPTGHLETSLSREDIQYTKHTLENIREAMRNFYNDVKILIDTAIDKATDRFEFSTIVYDTARKIFGTEAAVQKVLNIAKPNTYGITVARELKSFKVELKDDSIAKKLKLFNGSTSSVTLNQHSTCFKKYYITLNKNYVNVNTTLYKVIFDISNIEKVRIVISDDKHTPTKIKHSLNGYVCIISPVNFFPAELNKYIVYASKLPMPPKKQSTRTHKDVVKDEFSLFEMRENSSYKILASSLDSNIKYIGLPIENAKTNLGVESYLNVKKAVESAGYKVIGYRKGTALPSNVTDIDVFCKNYIDEHNTNSFYENYETVKFNNSLQYVCLHINILIDSGNQVHSLTSEWNKWKNYILDKKTTTTTVLNSYTIMGVLQVLCSHYKVAAKTAPKFFTVEEIAEMLYTTYPLLKYLSYSTPSTDIIDYINQTGK